MEDCRPASPPSTLAHCCCSAILIELAHLCCRPLSELIMHAARLMGEERARAQALTAAATAATAEKAAAEAAAAQGTALEEAAALRRDIERQAAAAVATKAAAAATTEAAIQCNETLKDERAKSSELGKLLSTARSQLESQRVRAASCEAKVEAEFVEQQECARRKEQAQVSANEAKRLSDKLAKAEAQACARAVARP
eukprot:5240962-Pleurochrysis_carterae.AAC.2